MSADDHILELIPAYTLGSLSEDETIGVSEHLAVCPDCREEAQAFHAIVEQMALAGTETDPPPELKGRLMSRVQRRPQLSTQSGPVRPRARARFNWRTAPLWALVGLVLLLALAVSNVWLWQQIDRPGAATSPGGMHAIPLSSTGLVPEATGFILISADGRSGAVVVDELPLLDEEHQYQLWLIREGQSTSGAVFSVDEFGYGGAGVSVPELLFEYSAATITIEPAGGSPDPTGERVLGGSL